MSAIDVFFDDESRPVQAVGFQYPDEGPAQADADDESAIRTETLKRLLYLLLDGADDPATVGRGAVLLASAIHLPGAPAGVQELGRFLGISHQAASRALQKTRDKLRQIGTI